MPTVGVIIMGDSGALHGKQAIIDRLSPQFTVRVRGVLDGQRASDLAPAPDEPFYVTSGADGCQVAIAERHAQALIERHTQSRRAEGAQGVLICCTGALPRPSGEGLVFLPQPLLAGLLAGLGVRRVGVLVPEPEQIPEAQAQYYAYQPQVVAASPYGDPARVGVAARSLAGRGCELVVCDCMGYTSAHGAQVAAETGCQTVVPQEVICALVTAVLGGGTPGRIGFQIMNQE